MSKTILADVDGFTPIIDSLAIEHGLIYASVFGRIWRFCQMSDGVCQASLETIAHGLHVNKATVMRYAERLVEDGYLKDMTPDLRNVPHTYADTGKASIRIGVVAQDNSRKKTVAHSNRTVAQDNETVADSKLKIVSKREKETKDNQSTPSDAKLSTTAEIKSAYLSCVSYPINWAAGAGASAKWLSENGYSADDVIGCYQSMAADPWWRDKQISLKSVEKKIGAWKSSAKHAEKELVFS